MVLDQTQQRGGLCSAADTKHVHAILEAVWRSYIGVNMLGVTFVKFYSTKPAAAATLAADLTLNAAQYKQGHSHAL